MSGNNHAIRIDFGERLDINNCKFFAENLPFITGNEESAFLDLSKLELLDSSGVQLLYVLYKTLQEYNVAITWSDLSDNAKQSIDILGMYSIFFNKQEV